MAITRRAFLMTTAVAATLAGTNVAFAETELVLSSWLPPRHPLVVGAI